METNIRLKMIRQQRLSVIFLIAGIIIVELSLHSNFLKSKNVETENYSIDLFNDLQKQSKKKYTLVSFNPNDFSEKDWQNIGFSAKQAKIILKYKNDILGGSFSSKEEIKKCFVINEEKFAELSPFMQLPEKSNKNQSFEYSKKKNYNLVKFNPNDYSEKDWQKIGFSEKQAQVILKYRQIVGGQFTNKDQLKKCFVINDQKYAELSPFLLLPEKNSNAKTVSVSTTKIKQVEKKELNTATFKDIVQVTDNASITGKLISFRNKLGGFVAWEQINDVFDITPEIIEKIKTNFDLDVSKVKKINLSTASEEELQNHIYLRRYKQKIIQARENGKNPKDAIPKNDAKYKFIILYLE